MVELTCEARVGDERICASQVVMQAVYDDPDARQAVEAAVRYKLVAAILDRWKPKIQVRR